MLWAKRNSLSPIAFVRVSYHSDRNEASTLFQLSFPASILSFPEFEEAIRPGFVTDITTFVETWGTTQHVLKIREYKQEKDCRADGLGSRIS